MEIIKTHPTAPTFQLFEDVVKMLYPENSIKHREVENINIPALHACYVVLVDGKPQARAALYHQPTLRYGTHHTWMVGNYECMKNIEVASELMKTIVSEAEKNGGTYLIGPMNGSTWDNYRFSITNDHPNFLFEPYHKLYYNDQFQEGGFEVIARYSSNLDTALICDGVEVLDRERTFADKGITIRNIRICRFEDDLVKLHPFIDRVFKGNFLYSEIESDTFVAKYLAALPIVNPDYVLLAENKDREIVGFIFSYVDLYSQNGKNLIIKTLAREGERAYAGLGHVLANRVIRLAKDRGFRAVVHAFIINEGAATTVSGNFTGSAYKSYTLYGKKI